MWSWVSYLNDHQITRILGEKSFTVRFSHFLVEKRSNEKQAKLIPVKMQNSYSLKTFLCRPETHEPTEFAIWLIQRNWRHVTTINTPSTMTNGFQNRSLLIQEAKPPHRHMNAKARSTTMEQQSVGMRINYSIQMEIVYFVQICKHTYTHTYRETWTYDCVLLLLDLFFSVVSVITSAHSHKV